MTSVAQLTPTTDLMHPMSKITLKANSFKDQQTSCRDMLTVLSAWCALLPQALTWQTSAPSMYWLLAEGPRDPAPLEQSDARSAHSASPSASATVGLLGEDREGAGLALATNAACALLGHSRLQ